MAWLCDACTFENRNEETRKCEICHTNRCSKVSDLVNVARCVSVIPANVSAASGVSSSRTVQSTLFGGIAKPIENQTKVSHKKRKAREGGSVIPHVKDPEPATKCNRTTNTDVKTRNNDSSTTIYPARSLQAASETMSYSALKLKADRVMKDVFGITKLRKLQPVAIQSALQRQNQIIIMATGGGKSLCYQLPAVVLGGTTVVISPLIALMTDQVAGLQRKGIEAAVISSTNGEARNLVVMERLLGRQLKARKKPAQQPPLKPVTLLYCAPEQLQRDSVRSMMTELYQRNQLSLIAVDEAHCVSSWGHDFRPAYRRLDWLRQTFPTVPCIACTATATSKVIRDIQDILHLKDAPCHVGSFNRENIFYKVRYKDQLDDRTVDGAHQDLVKFIQKRHQRCGEQSNPCSGIVYVRKREETIDIANLIQKQTGIAAAGYHGGLGAAQRQQIQEAWTVGEVKIAVATIAFGMGVDLPHVRYVVHWIMSKNIESFYQESGRAGRDGLPAYSLLYYARDDASVIEYLIGQRKPGPDSAQAIAREKDALAKMNDYAMKPGCRREHLLRHFGDMSTNPSTRCSKTCDYCSDPERITRDIEAATHLSSFQSTKLSSELYKEKEVHGEDHDENDEFDHQHTDWTVNGLQINHQSNNEGAAPDHAARKPSRNFQIASSVLSKYEAIESKQEQGSGFVRFKAREKAPVEIPGHLRNVAPDPLLHYEKRTSQKTSDDYGAEAERLRQEILKSKEAQEKRIKELAKLRERR